MYHFHIADDHPLFLSALTQVIHAQYPEASITQSQDLEETLSVLKSMDDLDLLLLDLNMPGTMGLLGLVNIREKYPAVPVVIVSANENQEVVNRAIGHGAMGYMTKSLAQEEMLSAIDSLLQGRSWVPQKYSANIEPIKQEEKNLAARIASLTPQQYKVLCLLKQGWLNKQIGFEMGVTEATVKAHATAIFRKLKVSNRYQAMLELNSFSPLNEEER